MIAYMTETMIRLSVIVFLCLLTMALSGAGSVVPVGEYLYADLQQVDAADGGLEIRFTTPSRTRLVIAYGWNNRKLRRDRVGTDEKKRQNFKPRLAQMRDNGTIAVFEKLSPDFYDIVVIDSEAMTVHEGLSLHYQFAENGLKEQTAIDKAVKEIMTSLGLRADRIGGWEGFFDTKHLERVEIVDEQAGVLLQQLRKGVALAESGEKLAGCIHSIDVVWVQRTLGEGNGWQVINRQQLYRAELPTQAFFKSSFVKDLAGIRVGGRMKRLRQPVTLP